ncbi:MAG: CPXCG motif-containing cysteine-rich protein [Cellvibrionaceae bacterium]
MLETQKCHCPYCGELIEVVLDLSVESQQYTEDCFVCCRPIEFYVNVDHDSGSVDLQAMTEND